MSRCFEDYNIFLTCLHIKGTLRGDDVCQRL